MAVVLYHRATPGATQEETGSAQATLQAAAEARGWEVTSEYYDAAGRGAHAWPARAELKAACERGDIVIVETLGQLARSLPDLVDTVGHLLDRGVHLVTASGRLLDTTRIPDRVTLHDAITLFRAVRHEQLAEAARSRHVAPLGPRPGRPSVPVNPLEVADLYHAGKSDREAVRELTRRGAAVSRHVYRKVLANLRAQGRLDDTRRRQAITRRGGLPKGGRTRKRRKVD